MEQTVLMPGDGTTAPTADSTDQAWKALASSHALAPLPTHPQASPAMAAGAEPDATVLNSSLTSGNPGNVSMATQPDAAPVVTSTPVKARSNTVWVLAGVGLLAAAGVAFKLLSNPGGAPPQVEQVVSPQTPASAAAVTALRPAQAASKTAAAAVAKKAALDKDKPTRTEPANASAPFPPRSANAQAPAPASAAANNPNAACEDRMLLGFQSCMAKQCVKPAFASHPICAERRAMEERRIEAERNR